MDQHICCYDTFERHGQPNDPETNNIGVIEPQCSLRNISESSMRSAQQICDRNFGRYPEVQFHGDLTHTSFGYISNHLEYILFEVLKNAMKATVEAHPDKVM